MASQCSHSRFPCPAAGPRRALAGGLGLGVAVLLGFAGFLAGTAWANLQTAATAPPEPVVAVRIPAVAPAPATAVAQQQKAGSVVARAPAGQPTVRPVLGGWVSSGFGRRPDPFTGQPAQHWGLDYAGLDKSAILAAGAGVVTWSGHRAGYGNLIEIDHGHGWITRYGHNAMNLVAVGDYVKPGQTIALMGATGRTTGTHLHFEVLLRGLHLNPDRIFPRDS